ncbi:hypothetical protein [Chryseobacterium paridis]|uniref:Bulb-type lectin domain-containing protein n=1 Tax=Chryseobacterium paridis TaxID=2800328 RepID=A0ABS1FVR7_9FLAO|nr:hypothetical protein [Chryseobacterium paridis]MBK1896495.1 hypothetical protein [Chryseobacterium paridis]
MKIKLLTFVSLSMLLASCGQDDTLDNVTVENGKVKTTENANTSIPGGGLTTLKFISETTSHPQVLNAGESISLENNGVIYRLVMQGDSNLVLYVETPGSYRAVWASNTVRSGGTPRLIAQNDGNLVIYNNNDPLWNSDSAVAGNVSNPHIKLQLYSRTGYLIGSGFRIKVILGGNNEERREITYRDI